MAISSGDGSIILQTKVDTTGIEQGTNSIRSATERTAKSIENLGFKLSNALNAGDTKSAQLINSFKKATEEVEKQVVKVEELKSKLQGLESGEIKIEDSSVLKLQSDFDKATASVEKTQNEIIELYTQLDELQMNAFKAPDTGEVMLTSSQQAEFDKLNAKLSELEPKLEANKQKANQLGEALKNAAGAGTQIEIDKTKSKLAEAESKLQNLSTKAEIAGQKMNSNMSQTKIATESVNSSLSRLGNKIISIAKQVFAFSVITSALRGVREQISATIMADESFRLSIEAMKLSLQTAAAPIVQALIPALQTLVHWLTVGMLYIAAFFGALSGKTFEQTMSAGKALNQQANAYKNAGKSAGKAASGTKKATKATKELNKELKVANKQLADFDDLIIVESKKMDDINTPADLDGIGGGGIGGGGVGDVSGIANAVDSLTEALSGDELKKLQSFFDYISTHKDQINTFLEIGKWVLLGLAIGKVIQTIGSLLGSFRSKDKALEKQTEKTNLEKEAVKGLENVWALAPRFSSVLIGALEGVTVASLTLIPQLNGARESANNLYPELDKAKESANNLYPELDASRESAYNLYPALDASRESANNLYPALDKAKESAKDLSPEIQNATNKIWDLDNITKTAMPTIESLIASVMQNSKQNIYNFCTNAKTNFDLWAENLQSNAASTATIIAQNIYGAFSTSGDNIKEFINATSSNFASWGNNMTKTMAKTATSIASNFASALSSAWNNFKSFMNATGQSVSSYYQENKARIQATTAMAGIAVGAILLAAFAGSVALAKGGIVPHATTALIGEKGKEAVLPLENNTEWMDILADRILMRNKNMNTNSGNIEVVLELDGREFGRAVVEQGNRESRRIGTRLVLV